MKIRKPFEGHELQQVSTQAIPDEDGGRIITLPVEGNASATRKLDITPYLGHGIDDWVWAAVTQLRAFLAAKIVTPATVVGYWDKGLTNFFDFLIAAGLPCQPTTLQRPHLVAFIDWLKGHDDWAYGMQKLIYDKAKAVLVALQKRQIVKGGKNLFPANPFPGSNARTKGATALSNGERIRLAEAIRDDLIAIHKGRFAGVASQALVVHLVALAYRTGANTTPLLDMTRDCLKPHRRAFQALLAGDLQAPDRTARRGADSWPWGR